MGWRGGSNSFFLLDRFIEFGDGLRVHLLKFVLANVPEKIKILILKKILKNQINYVAFSGTQKSMGKFKQKFLRI